MYGLDDLYGTYRNARKFQMTLNKIGFDFLTSSDARTAYYRDAVLANLIPPYGAFLKASEDMHEMDATLDLYGMTYDDVKYKTRTRAFNSAGSLAGSTLNYVSHNLNKLYR